MKLFDSKKDKLIRSLIVENKALKKRNKDLVSLCNEKDSFFKEMISDGLRHKSPLAAKHMAERRSYLKSRY
ncbi:MAG: hypothetical protein IKL41_07625 [Clostridia bacterium]|nr:hypothetical protein [Clostridia bacterium]MBR6635474.1 hypothetical protein [Clostridia bacterium]